MHNEKKEKFNYQFNDSLRVIFKYYYGSITITDITSSWEYAFENQLVPKETRGIILDYRKATFNVSLDEYQAIPDFYKKHLAIFGNLKIAILTVNPMDVVIPTLVESRSEGYCSKPFSTLEAAISWTLSTERC